MPKIVWLNGNLMPLESAVVSVADHAHLYGDGLFEGIRIYHHRILKLDEHLRRLWNGVNYLGFQMPMGPDELRSIVLETCRQADLESAYIRINVSRGTGLGLDPKNIHQSCNVMVMVSSLNLYAPHQYETGLSLALSPIRVIPADCLDPRLKCIGRYASNILAKQIANRQGVGDALMMNHQGQIAEGTGNNAFFVRDGVIRTPHPSCGILQGITRDMVMEMARAEGIPCEETQLTPFDVLSADEGFFTGTATEVIPVVSLDGSPIGSGKPGPITLRLMELFQRETQHGTEF